MTTPDSNSAGQTRASARTSEISQLDDPAFDAPLGRSPSAGDTAQPGSIEAEEIRDKSVGQRPSGEGSEFHLSGTGGGETDDGLDETGEQIREQAEGETIARADSPVFDRGGGL